MFSNVVVFKRHKSLGKKNMLEDYWSPKAWRKCESSFGLHPFPRCSCQKCCFRYFGKIWFTYLRLHMNQ